MNGTLYFTARSETSGVELWKSDGTEAGTVLVKDIRGGSDSYGYPYSSGPRSLTNVGGTLYFSANDGISGDELWKSDGTEAGTVLVRDIVRGNDVYGAKSSYPFGLTNVNGTLYFTADDGTSGVELWRSDGTEAGTVRVTSLLDQTYDFTNVGGVLYFRAYNRTSLEWETWKSDGTEAGTVKWLKALSPSVPIESGGALYFTGYDGVHGRELWVLRPEEPLLGDLNSDGFIEEADATLMFANWGASGVGDLNSDGIVDAADAGILFEHWTGNELSTSQIVPVAAPPQSQAMLRSTRLKLIDDAMENTDSEDWFGGVDTISHQKD